MILAPKKSTLPSSGVYRDEAGRTPILQCVKQAEAKMLAAETTKGYLGIEGLPEFNRLATELTMGELVPGNRIATTQTPGGTGSEVAADFIAKVSHRPESGAAIPLGQIIFQSSKLRVWVPRFIPIWLQISGRSISRALLETLDTRRKSRGCDLFACLLPQSNWHRSDSGSMG